jgi:hypothetical protein
MGIDPIAAALPDLQRIDLGPTMAQDAQAAQLNRVINSTADQALTVALAPPGSRETLPDTAENYLSSDIGQNYLGATETSETSGFEMNQINKMLGDLYTDVAVYKVAWSIAKRTGKDIETMLKGQ